MAKAKVTVINGAYPFDLGSGASSVFEKILNKKTIQCIY